MTVLLSVGRIWFRPRTISGWLSFWLCVGSGAATLMGVICVALPQHGHPSIGIFFFITPVAVNAIIIPVALLSSTVGLIRGEKSVLLALEFAFLLTGSFVFSHLRSNIPMVLDSVSGTKYFSRMVRRLDIACPDSNEMIEDPFLIKRCPLTYEKMMRLERVAGASSRHRCAVLEEALNQFATVGDFELKRRLLIMIFELCPDLNLDGSCERDLVSFLARLMEEMDADLSDIAAGFLAMRLGLLLRSDQHKSYVERLAKYALQRQTNPPKELGTPGSGKFYYQRTFDCTRQLSGVLTNLLPSAELNVQDRQAAARLQLFLPYLKARQNDRSEMYWQFNQRYCGEIASGIERLSGR